VDSFKSESAFAKASADIFLFASKRKWLAEPKLSKVESEDWCPERGSNRVQPD
jgi:hypothetical protein